VPSRLLDDRIRDLCARIVSAPESEFAQLLRELQDALAEKTKSLRRMAARKLLRDDSLNSAASLSEKENGC